MLTNKLAAVGTNERSQHESDHDHVIELAGDRDEVRHEVERQRQIADQTDQQELAATRHARIGKEPPQQHQAIRDEAHQRTRIGTPSRDNERRHNQRPDGDERAGHEQEQHQPAHSATVAPRPTS
jgi:hypothetical protein